MTSSTLSKNVDKTHMLPPGGGSVNLHEVRLLSSTTSGMTNKTNQNQV